MKSSSVLPHLLTVLTVTMLTVCPVASPGADAVSDANREPGAASGIAVQCPLPPKTAPAGRGGGNSKPADSSGIVLTATDGDATQAAEQSDLAGELLENLVRNDSD